MSSPGHLSFDSLNLSMESLVLEPLSVGSLELEPLSDLSFGEADQSLDDTGPSLDEVDQSPDEAGSVDEQEDGSTEDDAPWGEYSTDENSSDEPPRKKRKYHVGLCLPVPVRVIFRFPELLCHF
jgi:hypothetical protein